MTEHLVIYDYPGTTNGRPVGSVYVTGPHFGRGIYSHTYLVAEAARWPSLEAAQRDIGQYRWSDAVAVRADEAVDLERPRVGDEWFALRWENEHAPDCPVTRHRSDLLKQLARLAPTDRDYPVLAGAVPEYQPDGDQEADLCECGVVERS